MRKRISSSVLVKAVVMGVTVCVAVAIPYIYSLSFAQAPQPNKVHLPIVSKEIVNGVTVAVQAGENRKPGIVYVDKHPELGTIVSMAVTETIPLTDENGYYIPSPMDDILGNILEQQQQAITNPIVVSGPETAGSPVTINGKTILLPQDFYVAHTVSSILCLEGDLCPKTPVLVIGHSTTGNLLAIDADGKFDNSGISDEEIAQAKIEFEPILKQIEAPK